MLKTQLEGLEQTADGIRVSLDRQRAITVDAVVAAAGLRPETSLARHAGLQINRGIVVNSQLQTSDPAIYALGDCAEINGVVLPFLQPILLSAMCLSKNLLAQAGELKLPPMLVKVKTPGSAAASGRRHPPRRSDVEHRSRQRGAGGERRGCRKPAARLCGQRRQNEGSLCAAQTTGKLMVFPACGVNALAGLRYCLGSPAKRSASREHIQPSAPDCRSRASDS